MKNRSLPVKRNPVRKQSGFFRRLPAVTNRQRAATGTAEDLELDESGSGVSKAITILFLIHILAIVLFFVHQRFLDRISPLAKTAEEVEAPANPVPVPRRELPQLAPGEKSYIVKTGDNYARIAGQEQVDEADLRAANIGVAIQPGMILRIPPKKITAEIPPEVASEIGLPVADPSQGLVAAVDVNGAPKAVLVKPSSRPGQAKAATAADAGKNSHVIKAGENLWRIAAKYNTTPEALRKANGIKDERKLKPGQKIVIP